VRDACVHCGLEAGSDRWCGLLPSRLEVGRGGIGVVPTSPDEQVLGRGSASNGEVFTRGRRALEGKDS